MFGHCSKENLIVLSILKRIFRYSFTDYDEDKKYYISNRSYQDFCSEELLSEAYSLIYTDFPYTDQVPYLERNQLYRVWLNKFYNGGISFELTTKMLDEEIVQTDSPERKTKGVEQYYSDIDKMFKTFYKVLKSIPLLFLL